MADDIATNGTAVNTLSHSVPVKARRAGDRRSLSAKSTRLNALGLLGGRAVALVEQLRQKVGVQEAAVG